MISKKDRVQIRIAVRVRAVKEQAASALSVRAAKAPTIRMFIQIHRIKAVPTVFRHLSRKAVSI